MNERSIEVKCPLCKVWVAEEYFRNHILSICSMAEIIGIEIVEKRYFNDFINPYKFEKRIIS